MSFKPYSFRESAAKRALMAAQKAGVPISRIIVTKDGGVELVVGTAEPKPVVTDEATGDIVL
jgi:hypothetical protein